MPELESFEGGGIDRKATKKDDKKKNDKKKDEKEKDEYEKRWSCIQCLSSGTTEE